MMFSNTVLLNILDAAATKASPLYSNKVFLPNRISLHHNEGSIFGIRAGNNDYHYSFRFCSSVQTVTYNTRCL